MTSSRTGSYQLRFAAPARETLELLDGSPQYAAKLRKVRRALGLLQINPHHPGLQSHQYENFPGAPKAKVWDSYVENRTPGAWRIWWTYGSDEIRDNQTVSSLFRSHLHPFTSTCSRYRVAVLAQLEDNAD